MTNSPFLNSAKFNKPELAFEPKWAAHSDAIEKFETFRSTLELALSEQLETLSQLDTQHDAELTYAQEQVAWLYNELASTKEELAQTKQELSSTKLAHKSTLADLDSAWQTQLDMQENLIAQRKEILALRKELESLSKESKTPTLGQYPLTQNQGA